MAIQSEALARIKYAGGTLLSSKTLRPLVARAHHEGFRGEFLTGALQPGEYVPSRSRASVSALARPCNNSVSSIRNG